MGLKRFKDVRFVLPDGTSVVRKEAVLPALPIASWRRAQAAIAAKRRRERDWAEPYESYKQVLFEALLDMAREDPCALAEATDHAADNAGRVEM